MVWSRRHFLTGAAAAAVAGPALLTGCTDGLSPAAKPTIGAADDGPASKWLEGLPHETDTMWTGAVISEFVTKNATESTITSAVEAVSLPGSGNFTVGGGTSLVRNAGPGSAFQLDWRYPGPSENVGFSSPRGWFVQFDVANTRQIEFLVYTPTAGYKKPFPAWNLRLDDGLVWDYGRDTSLAPDAFNLIRFTLPDTGEHRVRFYMNALALQAVYAEPGAVVVEAPLEGERVFFLGDSLTQGTGQTVAVEAGSWMWRFGAMVGLNDLWNGGIGGTSFVADAQGSSANYQTRIGTDVAPAEPDIVFVTSYYNDKGTPAPEVGRAASQTLSALKGLPKSPRIYVTGAYDPYASGSSEYVNRDRVIKSACVEHGVPYIEPISGDVYDGSGKPVGENEFGPWITQKNRYRMIGADNMHQTDLGQKYFAYRMYDAYQKLTS